VIKNIRDRFKHFLKTSPLVLNLFAGIIFLYLKLVYCTSRWNFIWPQGVSEQELDQEQGLLIALWHNRLAYSMYICKNYSNVYGLASPHSDGQLIINIIKKMNYKVIEGSTNKNATNAVRQIIQVLVKGNKVVITPDGPRGPIYKINSNITRIADKYNKKIIPFSCASSRYFSLNSWDAMQIPKPFSKIIVTIGKPLEISGHEEVDNKLLENTLLSLDNKAKQILRKG
jgi:lysophospholipid acyltransferase (LPLAT)-like uncharacterized protein